MPSTALGQALDQDLWVTNGSVRTVARNGGTIYVGGQFTQVAPATGGGVPIDAVSAAPLASFPKVTGSVHAVAPDGAGGWYIGGEFSAVGGVARANVARVASNLSVTPWDPGANGIVRALAVSGARVFVGGDFTSIGGQPRNRVADLDATTGLAGSWNPSASAEVHAIAVNASTIFVAGGFTVIAGVPRNQIAAFDAMTGALLMGWNPDAGNVSVYALALRGSTLFVGGAFDTIGGQTRYHVAELDATTGALTPWNPGATSVVRCIAVSGTTIYLGGAFGNVDGLPRNRLAAVDTAGDVMPWNPGANADVRALAVNGNTIYAAGDFSSAGGQARNGLVAIDAMTGAATTWDPKANAGGRALAVGGGTVFAGGLFTSLGGLARENLAAFDATTGAATAWNPGANGIVDVLEVLGSWVFVGGQFDTIGVEARARLARLDGVTGAVSSWSADADATVLALEVSGNTLYAGGDFVMIDGAPRGRIAALDVESGTLRAWDPAANGPVRRIVARGPTVYASGWFTQIGGFARSFVAALDSTTGAATPWNPGADGSEILALAATESAIYVGGNFATIGGRSRAGIAKFPHGDATALEWNPGVNGPVFDFAVRDSTLYVAGAFTTIGGQPRGRVAALHAGTGAPLDWNPGADGEVRALAVSSQAVFAGGDFSSIRGLPHGRVAAIAPMPAITEIVPPAGANAGPLTASVSGSGLPAGAAVKLARSGQPDIPGSSPVVGPDDLGLTATFDLTGALAGAWNVVVTTPDLQTASLPGGFTVQFPAPHEIRADVIGPTQMRPSRRKAFDVVLENLGNGDVLNVPLWISRIPADATFELDFPIAYPPQEGGEPDWSTVPLTLGGPAGKYLALVIPRLPPGTTVRRLYLTVPNPVTSFTLDATLTPPWADGGVFLDCLSGGGVIAAPACVGARLAASDAYLAATPSAQALSGIALWAKIAWQCEGAASLPAALAKAEQVLDFMLQPVEGTAVPSACEVALVPRWQDRRFVAIVTSVDPNDKLGVSGVGAGRLIGSEQLLPYSIRFENLESATAPAQEVVVLDPLDAARLDLSTLSLGPITFGNKAIYPPPGLTSYSTDVDLRPEQELIVRVGASLDMGTGILSWSLTSIDPVTGALPEDPQVGFLPPNVTPPQGDGSVLFTVMPKPGLTGGMSISNQATIVFDGVPLATPPWTNTMDTTPPESHIVLPGAATTDSASFTVRWEAEGTQPDLRDFSVYVSENGSSFRPWRVHTTATADTIVAPGGRTYSFYSLARDSSGNLEPVPANPDVQTFSRVAVEERVPARLALEGAAPNPAMGEARVWFTLPNRERAVLEVMDVAGRRVLRREVGQLGPGRHAVDVSAATRRPGLYFLRLAQGDRERRARMVVIR